MGSKVSVGSGSQNSHPTIASGNSWTNNFVFSYANSGLFISSGSASMEADYNKGNIAVITANGTMIFSPTQIIPA